VHDRFLEPPPINKRDREVTFGGRILACCFQPRILPS
jgi:hypothetical protein